MFLCWCGVVLDCKLGGRLFVDLVLVFGVVVVVVYQSMDDDDQVFFFGLTAE